MNVAFVNENTLGHASYLLPFVRELKKRPELGITPHVIDATPLPAPLAARAHFSIRGLRRWGLDFQRTRWRVVVSRYVRDQVEILKSKGMLDAVVVNTQSVALGLGDLARQVPVFVCLDATFSQLCESAWFAPNRASRFLLPFTTSGLLKQERAILNAATGLFAWSESVRKSLIKDYHCPPERIGLMPPSTDLHRGERAKSVTSRRQILFIGGDFDRKGGRLLLECYRKWFSHDCDLQVVTQTRLPAEPGVYVHHSVLPYTADWYARWQSADVFVFPSTLETFGIVLVEALALGIPVIATDVGAVRFVLGEEAGYILAENNAEHLAKVMRNALNNREETQRRVNHGRQRVAQLFDLSKNTERLAAWLRSAGTSGPAVDHSIAPVRAVV